MEIMSSIVSTVGRDQYNIAAVPAQYLNEEQTLALLQPATRRNFYVPRCLEGTRGSIFREIDLWLEDGESTPNILWINGSPGTGKSAIASSLVSILTRRRKLASYFFFRRDSAKLCDPATLWRTVAFDLASYHPALKAHVIDFLSQPGFRDFDILQHFECLIEDGLIGNREELSQSHPVIVLDALDECGSDETHDAQRHILLETILSWARLPRSFKLIITSRSERLPKPFYDKQVCRQITLETGDSVTEEAQNDIRVFFKHRLNEIRPVLGCPPTWPGEQIINQLTDRAAGLFIWAKTAMEFMKEKHGSPSHRLKLVLAGKLGKKGEDIDTLYRNILDFAFADSDEATLELFRMVVGIVIVARAPLLRDDLVYFMYILGRQCEDDNWQISSILENLSSVLKLDGGIHLRHHSFAEFMCDPNRCRQQHFLINHSDHHFDLARVCLSVLKQELQFNICKLESSHFRNEDVVDLAERIAANISPRLSYSCRFWAAHLCDVTCNNVNSQILLREVEDFFRSQLLYWLEVMSLIGEIPSSSMMLLMAARWIETFNTELAIFARDASRFIANFQIPISESAPHIYVSALPFSPSTSLISKQYRSMFPMTLSVDPSRNDNWPALVNILTGHTGPVYAVAYSPDRKWIVSGSSDKTLRVWDAETGQVVMGPFKGHTGSILSVAYSPDGKRIVSGSSDGTLRVWDVNTGYMLADAFNGHTDWVASVAYSPDGMRIVSGSYDKTLLVWEADTGQVVMGPLKGHKENVLSVAYSPDGKRVVSGSADYTIRVWDIEKGVMMAGPFIGNGGHVWSIAYSPDGKQIISGSSDETLHTWDAETGEMVTFGRHNDSVQSVAYSPDGKRVISGSTDQTLRLWDVETRQMVGPPFQGHTNPVQSVAYSPDGKQVVSCSTDETLGVWDVEVVTRPFWSHRGMVLSVAYSPNGKEVVSGSADRTLCVWDVVTGQSVTEFFVGHTDWIWSVAYSPDGTQVVSGSADKTIRVWDVKTVQMVAGPFSGHTDQIWSVAYSPDGKRVVSGSADHTVRVWDIGATLMETILFSGHTGPVTSVAYSPDGKQIVSGSADQTIRVWDVETKGSVGFPFVGHTGRVQSVAYSPDGKWIVSGSYDKTLRVWDAMTGKAVGNPFKGHDTWVTSVAYSPDGKQIVSGSNDETALVWEADTGQILLAPFRGHLGAVLSVAYSPTGKQVVAASCEVLRVWNVDAYRPVSHSLSPRNTISPTQYRAPNGWTTLRRENFESFPQILFWVPPHARKGLCDGKVLSILGIPQTKLDLSRFVHGTSWAFCKGVSA